MRLNLLLAITIALFGMMITSCGSDTESESFDYSFSEAYEADPATSAHPSDLDATLTVEELEDGGSMITVELTNTIDGETYNIHAHDAADPATTPNGTPYNETPNAAVFANQLVGNGGTVSVSQETALSFTEVTTTYDAFFVVHDPLQAINTADISTYLIVGSFAREQ